MRAKLKLIKKEELSIDEEVGLRIHMTAILRARENHFYQHKMGMLATFRPKVGAFSMALGATESFLLPPQQMHFAVRAMHTTTSCMVDRSDDTMVKSFQWQVSGKGWRSC